MEFIIDKNVNESVLYTKNIIDVIMEDDSYSTNDKIETSTGMIINSINDMCNTNVSHSTKIIFIVKILKMLSKYIVITNKSDANDKNILVVTIKNTVDQAIENHLYIDEEKIEIISLLIVTRLKLLCKNEEILDKNKIIAIHYLMENIHKYLCISEDEEDHIRIDLEIP